MTEELKNYLLEQCGAWRLPEEDRAMRRTSRFVAYDDTFDREMVLAHPDMEKRYGFQDEKTNALVALGMDTLEIRIAERLLNESGSGLLNYCPKCHGLARTPYAKQCRHCGHDWH